MPAPPRRRHERRGAAAVRATGFRSFVMWDSPEAKIIAASPEGQKIQKGIGRVLQGG